MIIKQLHIGKWWAWKETRDEGAGPEWVVREGLSKEVIFEQTPKKVKEWLLWSLSGDWASIREQQMQRPWNRRDLVGMRTVERTVFWSKAGGGRWKESGLRSQWKEDHLGSTGHEEVGLLGFFFQCWGNSLQLWARERWDLICAFRSLKLLAAQKLQRRKDHRSLGGPASRPSRAWEVSGHSHVEVLKERNVHPKKEEAWVDMRAHIQIQKGLTWTWSCTQLQPPEGQNQAHWVSPWDSCRYWLKMEWQPGSSRHWRCTA